MLKKRLTIIALTGALLIGAIGAVSADEGNGRGPGGRGFGGGEIIDLVEEQTGLTAQEIRTELVAGATLAEVIEANGGDVQTVIDALVEQATERINTALENERLTQQQADALLANVETRVTERINSTFQRPAFGNRQGRGPRGGQPGFGFGAPDADADITPEVEATTDA